MKIVAISDYDKLEELIIKCGFNLSTFAKACGVSRQYINRILRKKENISPARAKIFREKLGQNFDDIFFVKEVVKK